MLSAEKPHTTASGTASTETTRRHHVVCPPHVTTAIAAATPVMATQNTAPADAAFSAQPWLLTNRRTTAANPTPTKTAKVTHRSSHDRDLRPTPTTSAASARSCSVTGTKPLV